MDESLSKRDLHWAAVLMRLAMGSLFLVQGITKVPGGVAGVVGYYSSVFEKSLLPGFLVSLHASVIMFVEFGLAIWLLSGYRSRAAWIATGVTLISLAVGMVFAGKYDTAADNFTYVFLAVVGLGLRRFDRWTFGEAP